MDGRGGCCIARYAGGAYDMSKVDRIMLRFRPIAPKPAAFGSVSGRSSPESSELSVRSGRGKRRYARDNTKRCNRKRKASPVNNKDGVVNDAPVVTLPLLPESPVGKDSPQMETDVTITKQGKNLPMWLNFSDPANNDNNNSNNDSIYTAKCHHDRQACVVGMLDWTTMVTPHPVTVVGSCVTVECVTDTWGAMGTLGGTDDERRRHLERDTCPGFISDGWNRVGWTNAAYRQMVGQGVAAEDGGEMLVWVVMKECVPWTCPAFTCRVRVQYTCMAERGSTTVPCDVWRMDGGGFAWRLDVNAALSLGR